MIWINHLPHILQLKPTVLSIRLSSVVTQVHVHSSNQSHNPLQSTTCCVIYSFHEHWIRLICNTLIIRLKNDDITNMSSPLYTA